jgi:beta-aspartyl-peptidase (threonine type)
MTIATPVVVVHGGAGEPDATHAQARAAGLARAIEAAREVLRRDGRAVDAVVETVAVLEDDPLFNAGIGAVFCADGTIELCASVMDGASGRVGAMAGLHRTRHPVRAAAALLDHRHGLLFGDRADAWAKAAGLETTSPDAFWTPERRAQWAKRSRGEPVPSVRGAPETVGAVARDHFGGLAAATSTGGVLGQLPGRVGDTPVVGAGTWADARCAVSATGDGDVFLRAGFARRLGDLVELAGLDVERAARQALEEVRRLGGLGGCIAIDEGCDAAAGPVICGGSEGRAVSTGGAGRARRRRPGSRGRSVPWARAVTTGVRAAHLRGRCFVRRS